MRFIVCSLLVNILGASLVDRVELVRYSFDGALTPDNTLDEWSFRGSSVVTHDGVVVVPAVASRFGHFWHNEPLTTSRFQMTLTFRILSRMNPTSNGFAIWYVFDDFDSLFEGRDIPSEFDLFGYMRHFNGIGVFVSLLGKGTAERGFVSVGISDGSRSWDITRDVPTTQGKPLDLSDPNRDVMLDLKVDGNRVIGQTKFRSQNRWTTCFDVQLNRPMQGGGYVGITSMTAKEVDGIKTGDAVVVYSLHMYNLDFVDTTHGSASSETGEKNMELLLKEVSELTHMLYTLINEVEPRESIIMKTLNSQVAAFKAIANDVNDIRRIVSHGNEDNHEVHRLKHELQGLHTLFQHHSKNQAHLNENLKQIQRNFEGHARFNDFVAEKSTFLHDTVRRQAIVSSWLSFIILVTVTCLAFYIWKRMRDMEKKHLL